MKNIHPVFTRKLLPSLIASLIATSANGAGDEIINTTLIGEQLFLNDSTSITVQSGGSITSTGFNDGISLDDSGNHNLTFINIDDGAVISAGWDAIYTGEATNTIGSITVAGDLLSTSVPGGIGVSVDVNTTVTNNVILTSTGSFIGSGTGPCDSGLSVACEVSQAGILVIGAVGGDVNNQGTIDANNGLSVAGFIDSAITESGSVGGNLINSGTMTVDGDAGLFVFGGAQVGGSVINNGTITAMGGNATGIKITGKTINVVNGVDEEDQPIDDIDGFVTGTIQTVVTGDVVNNGTITGGFDGIAINDNVLISGSVGNTGLIDVSSTLDGDAAAIYVGDDDDVNGALPTITSLIFNAGTLISDSSLQTDPIEQRIATVELDGSFAFFFNEANGVITNLDTQGAAIRSNNGEAGIVINAGTLNGTVRMTGGPFLGLGGSSSGEIIGAGAIFVGAFDAPTAQDSVGIQTVTINGDLTHSGILAVYASAEEGQGFTSNGHLNVTGNANVTGSTVDIILNTGSVTTEGDEFSFLSAGGTLTSDISSGVGVDLLEIETGTSVLNFTVEQRGQELFAIAGSSDFSLALDDFLVETDLEGTQGGDNVGNVAEALTNIVSDAPAEQLVDELAVAIGNLQGTNLNDNQKAQAIASLDPETVEASSVGAMAADTAAAGSVNNRQTALRGDYGISGATAGDAMSVYGFWVQGYANDTDQDVREGVDGFDADSQGYAMGLDTPINENVNLGVAFSYATTDVEGKLEDNEMSIDSYRLALYSSYNADTYYIDGQLAYAANEYDTDRVIDPNLTATQLIARGEHDGDQYSVRVRAGYPIATESGWIITPKAEIDYTLLSEENYTEKGAGNLGLTVATDDVEVLVIGLGVKVAYPITTAGEHVWIPEFSLDYLYDTIGDEVEIDSNFIGVTGAGFITQGANSEQEMIKASVRLRAFGQGNLSFSGGFDYIQKDDYESQSLMATVRYDF